MLLLKDEMKTVLVEKAQKLAIQVLAREILPDPVPLFVSSLPADAVQFVVNQLNGFPSRPVRQRQQWVRSRLPPLWTRSSSSGSGGAVSADTVRKYIANQKNV
jgi:putative transposase